MILLPPGILTSLSRDAHGPFPLPYRDLKPTNILLGDEGQPVLMDLGSMNQACIHVEGSRQALALQVRVSRFLCPPVPHPQPFLLHPPIWSHDCDLCPLFELFQDWAAQRCTISYRAPELFSVQSHCVIDERTDVWVRSVRLGAWVGRSATLYLLCGRGAGLWVRVHGAPGTVYVPTPLDFLPGNCH